MAFSPLRPILLAASRSRRMERTIGRLGPTKKVVERFVGGMTENQAVEQTRALVASGRYVTIDFLGEDTTDRAQADDTVKHYLVLLDELGKLPQAGGAAPCELEVSLKLSALGQFLPEGGHEIALGNARTICEAAEKAGVWVTIDAEDHTTTDSTLSIVRDLRKDFPTLGTVLQAYLYRTEEDCRAFAHPGSRIRLCKGAYKEPASVAHQTKAAVDAAFLRCLRILMEGKGYPMVASHDPAMISAALQYATSAGRGADDFEMQMLLGIRDIEQRRLANEGRGMRVYLPMERSGTATSCVASRSARRTWSSSCVR
jgi:proline dehydrogenase